MLVIQGLEMVLETDMSDRQMTLLCRFDPRCLRISAYDIHEWIYDTLKLAEKIHHDDSSGWNKKASIHSIL